MKRSRSLLILCMLLWSACQPRVNGQQRWIIPRLGSEIIFDGVPDEAAWEEIEPFPMITHIPTFGLPPTEQSVVKMAYDDDFVYLSGLLFVSNPDLIQAVGKKRDFMSMT